MNKNNELTQKLADLLNYNIMFKDGDFWLEEHGYKYSKTFNPCTDFKDLMPIAVELGVTYAVVSSYSGQFVSFQINGMYQGCDNRHTFEMDNPIYGDDLKVAMVKCCIKALEDLAQEETEYQVALAARCPELSREIVELSTQKTFKVTKKVI